MRKMILKKIISICLSTCILCSLSLNNLNGVNTEASILYGDVTKDGKISLIDAKFVLKASLGVFKVTYYQIYMADIDGNGIINLQDAKNILKLALGISLSEGYTEEEILDMAIKYYKRKGTDSNIYGVIDSVNGDEVTIHIFEDMPTHIVTLEWYTIDKKTGRGTNLMCNPVDLTSVL